MRRCCAAVGDGGFSMNAQELETAERVGAPFITVVLEDGSYSLIKMSQAGQEARAVPHGLPADRHGEDGGGVRGRRPAHRATPTSSPRPSGTRSIKTAASWSACPSITPTTNCSSDSAHVGQRSEVRGQRSEVRGSGVRGQEVRGQRSGRGQGSGVRGQGQGSGIRDQRLGSAAKRSRAPRLWTDSALSSWALPIAGVNATPALLLRSRVLRRAGRRAADVSGVRQRSRAEGLSRGGFSAQGPQPLIEIGKSRTDTEWARAGLAVFDGMDLPENRIDDPRAMRVGRRCRRARPREGARVERRRHHRAAVGRGSRSQVEADAERMLGLPHARAARWRGDPRRQGDSEFRGVGVRHRVRACRRRQEA